MEAWILVNTHAGRQRARQNGEQIRRVFALGGARTRLAYTESPQEGEAFLEQAAAAQPDLLVFCGGDGTLSHGINCLGCRKSRPGRRSRSFTAAPTGWTWAALGTGRSCMWRPLGRSPSPLTRQSPG